MAKKAITLGNLPDIAARLKQVRTAAGQTQTAVGLVLGLAPAYIQRYESGTIEPPLAYLVWFSTFFKVSVDWLLTGEQPTTKGGDLPEGKDYVDLPAWNQAPLDDEERELMGCALDVLRSGDKLPNVATALETSIRSLRDTVERDANRPRPRAPSWESPGSQKQASGGGQRGKRRANGSG